MLLPLILNMMANTALNKKYAKLFQEYSLNELMRNVQAETEAYQIEESLIPTTIVDAIQGNCYTVSPYTMLIGFGQEELVKLPFWARPPLKFGLVIFSVYLRFAELDKVQILNNFCLSTNILSKQFQTVSIRRLQMMAIERHPQHVVMIRSLNFRQHGKFMRELASQGWDFIVSRQVYLVNNAAKALKKGDNRKDLKLLEDKRYYFVPPMNDADYASAEHWYNELYLNKYSAQNVQFTSQGIKALHQANIIDVYLLYDDVLSRTVGVVGMVRDDDYMTVPILGYDTERPKKEGLYRRLVIFTLKTCHDENRWLNQSAGAPSFKRNRGAEAEIEYTAVYTAHLPKRRARVWKGLAYLNPIYKKLLQYWKL